MANGNPGPHFGSINATRDWTSALKKVNADKKGKNKNRNLFCLAQKVWDMALAGDLNAIKEIGDRVEGKAMQINVNEETQYVVLIGPQTKELEPPTYSPEGKLLN